MKYKLITVVVMGLLVIPASSAYAGNETYVCDYTKYATLDSGVKKVSSKFELTFVTDTITSKTVMVANNGLADIFRVDHVNYPVITYIAATPTGNIMTTTIDADMESVHSRHTTIDGDLVSSQYYGTCKRG